MTVLRAQRLIACVLLLPVVAQIQGCKGSTSLENVSVALRNTETYQYPTVGGDEEGATIVLQPTHYSISEMRRDATTNWIATYVYRPAAGFVGKDEAVIEISTGSDGASAPTDIKRVAFRFDVRN